jgi:hypothetical protein
MKLIKLILLRLTLIATTVWASLVIYWGDSQSSFLQSCIASAFALLGLLTLCSLGIARWRKVLLSSYTVLFLIIVAWWAVTVQPSNDRHWQTEFARLPYADVHGDLITMHNIRNFDYRSETDFTPAYYDKTYDLNKLEGVDLFAVYWMGPAIAHTIMSFNFAEQGYLAVSIEARKEQNEGYSTIKGFFQQYELIYVVADERDVIRLRTNYRHNPNEEVYLYRGLKTYKENTRRLFLEYVKKINDLQEKPTFYNTLLDNCTTAIWFNTRINPNHLPFSWKILLSGYVPKYLYESQRLDTRLPFAQLQQLAHINPTAQAADQSPDFSQRIRVNINKPQ